MDEELQETQDAYTEDDKTSENEDVDTSTIGDDVNNNDIESLKAKMAEMEKTIKTLTIQKIKAQEKAKKSADNKQAQVNVDENEISTLKERLDLRDFRDSHPDLDSEDIKEIQNIAKANNKTLEDTLSLGIVKGYLENKQEKKRVEDASISTNRSPKGVDNKPLFEEGMSEQDFRKAWEQYMQKQNII